MSDTVHSEPVVFATFDAAGNMTLVLDPASAKVVQTVLTQGYHAYKTRAEDAARNMLPGGFHNPYAGKCREDWIKYDALCKAISVACEAARTQNKLREASVAG